MPRKSLTQNIVDTTKAPTNKAKIDHFDTKVNGLLLKVLKSGKKNYYLRYTNERGKQHEKRLSPVDATGLSLKDARDLAHKKLAQIAVGENPFSKADKLKDIPTFGDFIAESYMPHIKGYKRSWGTDQSLLKNHILPRLGKKYMDEITRLDMVNLFSKHRETHKPASTNRIIILCRYIFNCALRWEVPLDKNPTSGIHLYPENNKRERYLSAAETKHLFETLDKSKTKMLKYIVGILLLTGARRGEVLNARWKDFDLERRIWTIPFNKLGKVRYVPISDGLVTLLDKIPRFESCPWVVPNPDTLKVYQHIFYAWDVARRQAGLDDLRLHDLRHSFASFLVNAGRSLYEVQKILGHTQIKTTQRYAHLSQDSLISAANTVMNIVPLAQSTPAIPNPVNPVTLIETC